MVVHKKKKGTKFRGHVTHGGGSRKKGRHAGSRGGRGNAGTGKRAGHMKAGMKDRTLGRVGFHPRHALRQEVCLNVGELTSEKLEQGMKSGAVTKEGKGYAVDLQKLGIGKLLGTGGLHFPLKVVVGKVSRKAAEKIAAAGGELPAQQ